MDNHILISTNHLMRKPTICICENKDADQLRGNREADQRLCFRYTDGAIPPLGKSKISSFQPASVTVQASLYQTWLEPHCWFSHEAAHLFVALIELIKSYCDCHQCKGLDF